MSVLSDIGYSHARVTADTTVVAAGTKVILHSVIADGSSGVIAANIENVGGGTVMEAAAASGDYAPATGIDMLLLDGLHVNVTSAGGEIVVIYAVRP